MIKTLSAVLLALALVAACGQAPATDAADPTVPPSTAVGTAEPAPSEPGPVVSPPVIDDPALLLRCGSEETFPAGALAGVGRAQLDNDPPAAVLRSVIAEGGEPDMFPADGWHRVFSDPDTVLFVALGPGDPPWVVVEAVLGPDGWTAGGYGACKAAPVLPAGISMADFWLDPDAPAPGPDATTLHGIIVERACANGDPPTGRVRPPVVVYGEGTVTITVTVSETPGGADCPGNPSVPITIELSQPLGERTILDGSVFPPRDTSGPPA